MASPGIQEGYLSFYDCSACKQVIGKNPVTGDVRGPPCHHGKTHTVKDDARRGIYPGTKVLNGDHVERELLDLNGDDSVRILVLDADSQTNETRLAIHNVSFPNLECFVISGGQLEISKLSLSADTLPKLRDLTLSAELLANKDNKLDLPSLENLHLHHRGMDRMKYDWILAGLKDMKHLKTLYIHALHKPRGGPYDLRMQSKELKKVQLSSCKINKLVLHAPEVLDIVCDTAVEKIEFLEGDKSEKPLVYVLEDPQQNKSANRTLKNYPGAKAGDKSDLQDRTTRTSMQARTIMGLL